MTRDLKDYQAFAEQAGIELFGPVEGGERIHPELSDEELFEISKTVIDALIDGPLSQGKPYNDRCVWLRELIIAERLKTKAAEGALATLADSLHDATKRLSELAERGLVD